MKNCNSLSVHVSTRKLYDNVVKDKNSINRFKDYSIKRIVKETIKNLIISNKISENDNIELKLNIDEQPTSSDGFYNLRQSIIIELKKGMDNFEYGVSIHPILYGQLKVKIKYFESEKNYLGQAADIIANRIWSSYTKDKLKLREINNHVHLELP